MIRVLITSNDHPEYNRTGFVIRDMGSEGIEVELESDGRTVHVPEKQWKVTSLQNDPSTGQ